MPRIAVQVRDEMRNIMVEDPGTGPITTRNRNGVAVVAYRVTFDGRKITVHGPDGPRTRTCRSGSGYAQDATLQAMGYHGLFAICPDCTDAAFCYTTPLPR
ncbi:hypothetical protein [Amycolatopsis sp. NPDC098790]|uniref:hypothetical protein n=1 Tax=Amycolatopsis sp. NPDC098790 TaxID=3363939 RepID=UPI00380BAA2A